MNFLAHLALAGPDDASRIGNILGDFEKGTPDSIRARLPAPIVDGIMMHRRIDRFTDDHPAFLQTKLLLAPERRRFAGIIVDIFFDHFLNEHWERFHPGTVTDFIEEIYQLFGRRPEWLGRQFGPLVPLLRAENWLASYGSLEGLNLTLGRVASRSHRFDPIRNGVLDLAEQREEFEKHFLSFYPEVRRYAARLLGKKTLQTPAFP
ncbi:ACP phosphodiesterase [Roseibacillus persicicus]|uniref:acyl carrier protein phosphodiesterase n=1 Tax=Roseibacillus persicicus TaxID=454148 RepID=UPI00398AA92F